MAALASRRSSYEDHAMTSPLAKKLLTPVQIGWLPLSHCVVMPALSRLRAQPGSGIPSDLMLEYYSQRVSDGGFIVTEATAIAASARGYYHAPSLYTKEQEAGWSRVARGNW
jgi:N-ethylmaleimide reductase